MKPLKILHTDFHTGWGGQASRVLMLSIELARRGHRVAIAAPEGELTARTLDAARELKGLAVECGFVFRAPSHAVSFISDGRKMSSLLKREEFDLVDVHGSQDTWVTAMVRAASGRPRCLVMTRHNTKRVRTGPANRLLYGRLIDHLIIVDESVRLGYSTFLHDGLLDPSRISVVPSAYRADLFHENVDGHRVRNELAIPGGAVVIGVAGRLAADKGHTHLLRAAVALAPRTPRTIFVFAGVGPQEARLKEEARALGLAEMVRFLGFRPDIAEVQAAFDIAVLPSVGCDASSASIKEAMALGRPVIATDIGGARGIIDDGVTGLVVRPGDPDDLAAALQNLIEHPEKGRSMADRARRQVASRYSVGGLADGTLAAYAHAMERRAGLRLAEGNAGAGKTA